MASIPSYARVNYSLRPSKHVERRMIFEALRRLDRIADLTLYRYVGFGSPFFVDFRLAHREIGIQSLLNIERETQDEERFRFNRPFGCIEMEFGAASEVLDRIDWSERSIVWLDFDKRLNLEQLADVSRLSANLTSGSVLVVTTNAEPYELQSRVERLAKQLGEHLPLGVDDADLLGDWETAKLYRSIIDSRIREELEVRNEGLPGAARLRYDQCFNFHYADGLRMLTIGGTLFDAGMVGQAQAMDLDSLDFVRRDSEPYLIEVPHLTHKEMTYLEGAFPCAPEDAGLDFLTREDVGAYARVYRYFPRFADVDI